jgi:hypothetical protein
MGAQSVDEVRERVLGLPVDHLNPIPRYVMTRTGLVPLASVLAISGADIDPDSLSPAAGTVEHIDDEPQPASLPGEEKRIADIVGPIRQPQNPSADTPPATPPAGTDPATSPATNSAAVVKELAVFARFAKSRTERGRWRDFDFRHVDNERAGLLNTIGRIDPALALAAVRALSDGQNPGLSP